MHISLVLGSVLGAVGLELQQVDGLDASQFTQYAPSSIIQVLVGVDEPAWQLHVMKHLSVFFAHTLDQQHAQFLAIKADDHTVDRDVVHRQWHCYSLL